MPDILSVEELMGMEPISLNIPPRNHPYTSEAISTSEKAALQPAIPFTIHPVIEVLSFFFPGAAHVYCGSTERGLTIFFIAILSWWAITGVVGGVVPVVASEVLSYSVPVPTGSGERFYEGLTRAAAVRLWTLSLLTPLLSSLSLGCSMLYTFSLSRKDFKNTTALVGMDSNDAE